MPLQPDELELNAGDRVRHCNAGVYQDAARWRGTVEVIQEHLLEEGMVFYRVLWDAGHGYHYARSALIRICNNCDMRYEDHGDNGKCLYSPTSWS